MSTAETNLYLNNFLLKYKSLFQTNPNSLKFEGNFKLNNGYYRVAISIPNFPAIHEFKIKVFKGFREVAIDEEKIEPQWNADELLQNLPNWLRLNDSTELEPLSLTDLNLRQRKELHFLNQLLALQSDDYKVFTNEARSVVRFENFTNYLHHFLALDVTDGFEITVKEHSLPFGNDADLFSQADSLRGFINQFQKILEQLEEFYANINTIDELCYVLEPVRPTTKDNWRIFKLTENVYIKVIIDPFSPSSVVVNLIGQTTPVEKFREMYNERAGNWDIDMDVHKNILKMFDLVYLPIRIDPVNEEERGIYCNICYSYLLDDHIPLVRCDNAKCNLIFHIDCIKKWFATQLDGKTFLTVTVGSCPFCKHKLSASFSHLLD